MASLRSHPEPFATYLAKGGLIAVCPDGVTLIRRPHSRWKVLRRKRKEEPLGDWRARKDKAIAEVRAKHPWRFARTRLITPQQIEAMQAEQVPVTTPTGHVVEPDGTGPDGSPSWLRFLGLV